MKKMCLKIRHGLHIFFYTLFVLLYCDAPHENPLDPLNKNTSLAVIEGLVIGVSVPSRPVPNVTVNWSPGGRFAVTDGNGHFQIANLKPENGLLQFTKPGYLSDSLFIQWNSRKSVTVQKQLNACPVLDSLRIYSEVLYQYPDLQTGKVIIQAGITDTDLDIDSVYVNNPYLDVASPLKYNLDSKMYEQAFKLNDLNVNSIEDVVGYDFDIVVRDRFSHFIHVGKGAVKRVMPEVEFQSPSNYQEVTGAPRLRWKAFRSGFLFTFTIQVYKYEFMPEIIWQKTGIPADSVSYTVDSRLPVNNYFWVIWCVDEFYNQSRSKPASFKVSDNN
ncbi:carboxypeptidase regulatory-like domain-containing protein [candidate division KSB1 bacterium]|nr:carboxypeptidase regulatory-like domain-containing protein [candidate division KSB1 bacterium]